MNKPVLFIDEKPFWDADDKAIKALSKLKDRLAGNENDPLIEFFFEKNDEFPFDFKSDIFQKVVDGRSFIFIHNSYPHTKGRTLFPLQIIRDMEKNLAKKVKVIKFSGQMYRRGYDDNYVNKSDKEQLKIEQRLIESDILIERDDIYANTDKFLTQWKNNIENPNFHILKYGIDAERGKAQEIEIKMKAKCWEEYVEDKSTFTTLVSTLESNSKNINHKHPKKQLKKDWKDLLLSDFEQICHIAKLDEDRITKGRKLIMSDKTQYNTYFGIIAKLINKEIQPLFL